MSSGGDPNGHDGHEGHEGRESQEMGTRSADSIPLAAVERVVRDANLRMRYQQLVAAVAIVGSFLYSGVSVVQEWERNRSILDSIQKQQSVQAGVLSEQAKDLIAMQAKLMDGRVRDERIARAERDISQIQEKLAGILVGQGMMSRQISEVVTGVATLTVTANAVQEQITETKDWLRRVVDRYEASVAKRR